MDKMILMSAIQDILAGFTPDTEQKLELKKLLLEIQG